VRERERGRARAAAFSRIVSRLPSEKAGVPKVVGRKAAATTTTATGVTTTTRTTTRSRHAKVRS